MIMIVMPFRQILLSSAFLWVLLCASNASDLKRICDDITERDALVNEVSRLKQEMAQTEETILRAKLKMGQIRKVIRGKENDLKAERIKWADSVPTEAFNILPSKTEGHEGMIRFTRAKEKAGVLEMMRHTRKACDMLRAEIKTLRDDEHNLMLQMREIEAKRIEQKLEVDREILKLQKQIQTLPKSLLSNGRTVPVIGETVYTGPVTVTPMGESESQSTSIPGYFHKVVGLRLANGQFIPGYTDENDGNFLVVEPLVGGNALSAESIPLCSARWIQQHDEALTAAKLSHLKTMGANSLRMWIYTGVKDPEELGRVWDLRGINDGHTLKVINLFLSPGRKDVEAKGLVCSGS